MTTPDPYAVFRPRRGPLVARLCAAAIVVVLSGVAWFAPWGGEVGWSVVDRVLLVLFSLLIGSGLWRFSVLRAVPTRDGLTVVNLIRTSHVEWAQILRVTFSGGTPWVLLELADTEELAVMGIQRADGALAQAEASRLAALVEHHSQ